MDFFTIFFVGLIIFLACHSFFWQLPRQWKRNKMNWSLILKAGQNNLFIVLGTSLIAISWIFEKISLVRYESDLKDLEHSLSEYRFHATEFQSWLQAEELRRWSVMKPGLDSPTIRGIARSMLSGQLHDLIESTEAALLLAADTTSDFFIKTRSSIPEWKYRFSIFVRSGDTFQLNKMLTEVSPTFQTAQHYQYEASTTFIKMRTKYERVHYFYLIAVIAGSILISTNAVFKIAKKP